MICYLSTSAGNRRATMDVQTFLSCLNSIFGGFTPTEETVNYIFRMALQGWQIDSVLWIYNHNSLEHHHKLEAEFGNKNVFHYQLTAVTHDGQFTGINVYWTRRVNT